MPTYDYECPSCRNEFEMRQGFSSEPVADCPKCGRLARRVIRAVPVVFKGSGWYVNDYGKKGAAATSAPPKEAGEPSVNGAKSEAPAKSASEPAKASGESPKAPASVKSSSEPAKAPASKPSKASKSDSE